MISLDRRFIVQEESTVRHADDVSAIGKICSPPIEMKVCGETTRAASGNHDIRCPIQHSVLEEIVFHGGKDPEPTEIKRVVLVEIDANIVAAERPSIAIFHVNHIPVIHLWINSGIARKISAIEIDGGRIIFGGSEVRQ